MMQLKNFLKTLPTFALSNFSESDIDTLVKALYVEQYPGGHAFTYQDKQGQNLYLLIDGEVQVSRNDEITGKEQKIKIFHSGELFGLLSLLNNMPAAATCTAVGPVTVASLPRAAFNLLFQSAAPIAHHFQFLVANQLAHDIQDRNRSLRALLRQHTAA
jgi:CRP-like cAMP-binding protein